jgi:hypothetical protein
VGIEVQVTKPTEARWAETSAAPTCNTTDLDREPTGLIQAQAVELDGDRRLVLRHLESPTS